jgi:hypothetical protein
MTALAERPSQGEGYPPSLRRQRALFRELNGAIADGEIVIARHFRAFARAIADKLPVLVGPFVHLALDEYADAVDTVLAPELEQLHRELTVTVGVVTRRTLAVGAAHGQTQLPGITIDWDIDQPEVDRFLRRHVLDLAKELDDTTRARLATVIRRGVREGQSVAQIQQAIMETARRMSVQRARAISQTEVIRAFAAGSVQVYRNSGLVRGLGWIDGQSGACGFCRNLHNKIIRLDAGAEFAAQIGERALSAPYPPAHVGCLTSDTRVTPGGRIANATERWYEGDLILIRTAAGRELSITPNHPVLGLSGWLAAKLLQPGSYVICGTLAQSMVMRNPDSQQVPPTIEEVFRSLISAREVTARRVPVAAKDFHGDGFDSDVNVVWADRQLGNQADILLTEPVGQLDFSGRAVAQIALSAQSIPLCLCCGFRDTANRSMGVAGLHGALLGSHARPLERFGLGLGARGNASLGQDSANRSARQSEVLSYPILRDARNVHADQVISIEVRSFSGHVYNLETEQSWYSGNGIIVHNCRCTVAPVLEEITT